MKSSFYYFALALSFVLLLSTGCRTLEPCEVNGTSSGISITVKNESGNSLEGVQVTLISSDEEFTGVTSSNGVFAVREIKAGAYEVKAERQGYLPKTENLYLNTCEAEEKVEFVLEKGSFLSPAHLDFGNTNYQKSATINNYHSTEINYSAITNRTWLSVYSSEGSIDAHGSHSISIELDRTQITSAVTGIVTVHLTSKSGESLGSDDITISVRP